MTNPKKQSDKHLNGIRKSIAETTEDVLPQDPTYRNVVKVETNDCPSSFETINNNSSTQRLIMDASLDAIICLSIQGNITFWNPQAEVIFGWKKEDVLGQKLSSLIIPVQYRKRHDDGMATYLKTGKGPALNKLLELSALHNNGKEFPIELTIMPIKEDGVEFFCAFIRDITEKKLVEKKLKESEVKYRNVIEQATDAICITDASMKIIDINTSGCQLLGYSKEEFLNLTVADLFDIDDLVAIPFMFDELRSGKVVSNERKLKRKDGTLIEVELNVKLLEDGRLVLFGRDITKRKQADKSLYDAYEEKNVILESIGDAFFAVDKDWIVTYWNKEAEIKLNILKQDILGKYLWDAFPECIGSKSYKKYHEALETNQVVNFEDYFPAQDKWKEISAFPSGTGLAIYSKDITENKKAEAALQKAYSEKNTILESIGDAFFAVDKNWIVNYWNKEAEIKLNTPKNKILGKYLWEVFADSIDSISYIKYHEAIDTNQVVNFEDHYPTLDKWYEISAYPSATGLSVYFKDITENKKAGAALQKAYAEKNTILESIDDGFFALDTNSVVTYWNKRAEILLDTKKEDLIGKKLHDVFVTRGSRIFYDNYVKALREKITIQFEGFSTLSKKWFAVSAYGSDTGLSVYFKDITENKKAVVALQKAYAEKNTILESIDDGFFAVDNDSRVTYWNRKAEILLGEKREDVIGRNIHEMFASPDSKDFYNNYQKAIRENSTVHFEAFSKRSGKWFAVSAFASQNGLSVHFKDVSERIAYEEKVQESEVRYRSLVEQATDAICIADTDLKFIDVNPSGCQMFGYSKNEFGQLNLTDILFADDLETNPIQFGILKAGKTASNERRVKRKDGSIFEIELTSKMLEDGKIMIFGRDISERKESERLIKESEAKYRSFFESSMDGILLTVTDGAILSANPAACEMFNMTEEEICTSGRFGVADLSDPRLYALIETRQRTGRAQGEVRLLRKDGSKFEAELTSAVFIDSYGRDRTSMIVRDISVRKQAELHLRESNERYNLISQATNDMVWDWDLATGKVFRNAEGWRKIFRTTENEIGKAITDAWDSRIHPDDKERVTLINDGIQHSSANSFELECRVLRDDGSYAYIHDRGNIIRDEQGKPVRVIGASQDITQRKEAELQVAKSELRFRSLVQNSSDHISIFNENGYFMYSSPAIKNMLGYQPEEIIEKNVFTFIHPDDIDILKMHLKQVKTTESLDIPAFRFKNAQGEWRWLESKISDMSDNQEIRGYVFNSRDVTERKRAEEEIEKLSIVAKETVNAVIVTDIDEKIVWVNEAFTRITEFEASEVIGKRPGDFLQGEETNPDVVSFMRSKIKAVEPFECDILNYSKYGRKYWLRIQCQPQFDEAGKLKYFFAIETDITKEKEAEEILRVSEERYRYLFNNNPACISIWDIETLKILEVNNTAKELYGYSREAFLDKTIFDFSAEKHREKLIQFAVDAGRNPAFRSENTCKHYNHAGQVMYMNISSHRIQFRGRDVILALASNITDKRILEKELEKERLFRQQEITQAVISAQEQERHELGGELHDNINQILAGSLLYLGLAKRELKVDNQYLTETDILINSAITEIRNLSHSLIPPSLNDSELLGALKNIIEVTQKTSGLKISLQVYGFDENLVEDKLKLSIYRIVQEQFNNILKHAYAKSIMVRLVQDNEKTMLSISDDGIGFDSSQKANGVGLMNIKTRASLFNGEMSIISSPGNGCQLRVVFN